MNISAQEYLDMIEKTGGLVFFDIESSGLRADYGSALVVSLKEFGHKARSFHVQKPGLDRVLVREAKAALEEAKVWVSYYGKGFDIPFLNTRLLKAGLAPIEKRPHIDMYFTLKTNILTSRKSQSHLLSWLGTPQQKMGVSANVWTEIISDPDTHMPKMIARCESDCKGLEALYRKTRHVIRDIDTRR